LLCIFAITMIRQIMLSTPKRPYCYSAFVIPIVVCILIKSCVNGAFHLMFVQVKILAQNVTATKPFMESYGKQEVSLNMYSQSNVSVNVRLMSLPNRRLSLMLSVNIFPIIVM